MYVLHVYKYISLLGMQILNLFIFLVIDSNIECKKCVTFSLMQEFKFPFKMKCTKGSRKLRPLVL